MIPFAQRGQSADVEVKRRKMMATTRDSPDNSIESRKKSTGIRKIMGPIIPFYFDVCFNYSFVRFFLCSEMTLNGTQNNLLDTLQI